VWSGSSKSSQSSIQQQVAEPVTHPGPSAVDKMEGVSWGMDMDDYASSPESSKKTRLLLAQFQVGLFHDP
jgi:hypothetical protein